MLSSSLTEDLLFLLGSKDSLFQVRKLASVCGKIFSALGNCIGNITRLMTRDTFAVVNSVTNWNSLASLAPDCINELNFWKDNLAAINGVPLWPVKRKPTKMLYPVASNSACGSWIQFVEIILLQNWSDLESSRSSEFRGLLAVSLSFQKFIDSLEAQTVVGYTDNQNVVCIVNIGFKVPALQKIAPSMLSHQSHQYRSVLFCVPARFYDYCALETRARVPWDAPLRGKLVVFSDT